MSELVTGVCADCGAPGTDYYPLVSCPDCGSQVCQVDSRCVERHAPNDASADMYGCPTPRHPQCGTCGCLLDNPGDSGSLDCGGDCRRCMADAGDPDCLAAMRSGE